MVSPLKSKIAFELIMHFQLHKCLRCYSGFHPSICLPITAKVPSRMPTADWIVGIPSNCVAAILQFPLMLQGHTVTNKREINEDNDKRWV